MPLGERGWGCIFYLSIFIVRFLFMKRLLFVLTLLCSLSCAAQTRVAMLLDEYTDGIVYLKSGIPVRVPLNYDGGLHYMRYIQDGQTMELQNVQDVDSVKIGARKFVPMNGRFCEVFYTTKTKDDGVLLVEWSMSRQHVGYKGVMGNVSQVRGKSVNVSLMDNILAGSTSTEGLMQSGNSSQMTGNSNQSTAQSQDVYKTRYYNVYYIYRDGKARKFKDKKQLLKLFPDRTEEVEKVLRHHHADFQHPQTVIDAMMELLNSGN